MPGACEVALRSCLCASSLLLFLNLQGNLIVSSCGILALLGEIKGKYLSHTHTNTAVNSVMRAGLSLLGAQISILGERGR